MSDIAFDDVDIPKDVDTKPETTHELVCQTCGIELEYAGRGRKPKYCEAHKPRRGTTSNAPARGTKKNQELAAAATESLCQVNALVTTGFLLAQMTATASAMAERDSAFREQAYGALLTDPALCQQILKAGETSAKLSLVLAYVGLGAAVAPYAIAEVKDKRAAKAVSDDADWTDG